MSDNTPVRRRGGEVARPGTDAKPPRRSVLPAPGQGFGLTFAQMFKKVTTEEYPFDPKVTKPRYHGRHVLNRHPDGLEKCVGCELRACRRRRLRRRADRASARTEPQPRLGAAPAGCVRARRWRAAARHRPPARRARTR